MTARAASERRRRSIVGVTLLLPWALRRRLLNRLLGYRIHPEAHIGLSWIAPERLEMGAGASIGHLNVCRGPSLVRLGPHAVIGRLNWITAHPACDTTMFTEPRAPELILGAHSALTHRHLVDCTDRVEIGAFAIVAGWRTQVLTHSVDIASGTQRCRAIHIGRHAFVATKCVLVSGAVLPDCCVLGAGSTLHKAFSRTYALYSGVPAVPVRDLPADSGWFTREWGRAT